MSSAFDDLDLGQTIRGFAAAQKVFGRYVLTRMIGRGGMGVVWLARDEQLEVDVALKFLPELVALDRTAIDDMKRETRRSRELAHRSIVKVHQFELEKELAAISMEYVDGDTLANLKVDRPGKCFSHAQLGPWIAEICDALEYAHSEAKMVHRDLKPANVMLNSRSRIKITDFGIASSIADSVSQLSARHGSSGTPPYMSPQQAAGTVAQPSDDIYSLGATIYDLITGKPPFFSGNIHHQVETVVPPLMAERRKELGNSGEPIPNSWEQTIAACLSKDSGRRPKTAGEVMGRLGLKAPSSVEAAVSAVKGTRRLKQTVVAVGIAALLFLIVAGYLASQHWKAQTTTSLPQPTAAPSAAAQETTAPTAPLAEASVTSQAPAEAVNFASVTKEQPYINSLGMKFVPVPGTNVLFSIWETRVKDYRAFVEATKRDWSELKDFKQTEEHPAALVSWRDATAFCQWLTEEERNSARISHSQSYRLPTDLEWSAAVGLKEEIGDTPSERNKKVTGVYPWGTVFPPPIGAGNYRGNKEGYRWTAPVGSFEQNKNGIFDLGGNVWEWCEDHDASDDSWTSRVARGASFSNDDSEQLLSSYRHLQSPSTTNNDVGFRCVLVEASHESRTNVPSSPPQVSGSPTITAAGSPERLGNSVDAIKDATKAAVTIQKPPQFQLSPQSDIKKLLGTFRGNEGSLTVSLSSDGNSVSIVGHCSWTGPMLNEKASFHATVPLAKFNRDRPITVMGHFQLTATFGRMNESASRAVLKFCGDNKGCGESGWSLDFDKKKHLIGCVFTK